MSIVSLVITFIVLAALFYTVIQNQNQQRQYFLDQIQHPLIELQGIIEHQKEHNWDNPRLVIQQLDKIRYTIVYGTSSSAFSVLSNGEKNKLMQIYSYMSRLPSDTLYELASWANDDTKVMIEIDSALIKANFKTSSSIENNWRSFMQQCDILIEELQKMR